MSAQRPLATTLKTRLILPQVTTAVRFHWFNAERSKENPWSRGQVSALPKPLVQVQYYATNTQNFKVYKKVL